jgi:MFS family permease
LAWGASVSAEWSHFVALGVFAYAHGGTTAVGIAGLVRLLPAALIAPFATSLGDRFRRERFLLGVSLLGATAFVASAAGAVMGVRSIVFGAAAAVGVCSTLFRPALQALLPSLARTAKDLIAANGATSTVESLGALLGPLAAGMLVAFADVGSVFAAGAAALLVSAALLARVSVDGRPAASASGADAGFLHGFRAIAEVPRARLLVGLMAAQTFVRGCLNVLIVVAAYQVLHKGAAEVGYLTAAVGAGGLVGALRAVSLRGERLAPPFGWALVFWGVPIVLIAPLPYLIPVAILLAVIGAANSIEDVAGFTLLQRIVPDDVLARVLGVTWGLAMGGVAIGSFLAPAIVRLVGPRPAFLVVGAILPVLVLISHRRLVEIDAEVAPAPQLALIDGVAIFAPLSLVAKERIASHLVRVDVPAGDIVIRAGEAGDRFYVVDCGTLTIEIGARSVRAGPGDFFGEIALLRDVPRTATVWADTDARLYALGRDDFLAIVTGHSAAHREANVVVSARLARG